MEVLEQTRGLPGPEDHRHSAQPAEVVAEAKTRRLIIAMEEPEVRLVI